MTRSSGACAIVVEKTYFPSTADKTDGYACFWRHRYKYNTSDVARRASMNIPKVVWAFWMMLDPTAQLPPWIPLCHATWRAVNPDWEFRLLDDKTVWDWLRMEDMPEGFAQMHVQHKADAIRLALLVRYGGVWVDTSMIMLKPLSSFVGGATRPFFNIDMRHGKRGQLEARIDKRMVIENWFLAAPPGDPLLQRTMSCVWQLQPRLTDFAANPSHKLLATMLFSYQQWQEMGSYNIVSYLSTHACFFKSLDEDIGLWHWYFSNAVQHLDAGEHAYRLAKKYGWYNMAGEKKALFHTSDAGLVDDLLAPPSLLMKFNSPMREALLAHQTPHDLWCKDSTFHMLLERLNVTNAKLCHHV